MPIKKVKGGYKWGNHGKTYKSKKKAAKQAAAAYANGYKGESVYIPSFLEFISEEPVEVLDKEKKKVKTASDEEGSEEDDFNTTAIAEDEGGPSTPAAASPGNTTAGIDIVDKPLMKKPVKRKAPNV